MLLFVGSEVRHRGSQQKMIVHSFEDDFAVCTWEHAGQTRRRRYRSDELSPVVSPVGGRVDNVSITTGFELEGPAVIPCTLVDAEGGIE